MNVLKTDVMIKMDYLCDIFDNQLPLLYTLMQGEVSEMFYVCVGDKWLGTINKVTDGWEQINGSKMPTEFVNRIGSYIECKYAETIVDKF